MLSSAKKSLVSRTNSPARIKDSSQGLFSVEPTLSQEVSEKTGNRWPFTKRADSKKLTEKVLKNNLLRKDFINSHPEFRKMGLSTRDSRDGESETSLLQLLQKMSDYKNETAVDKINSLDWSEQVHLSEFDTETGAALKVAAQPVARMEIHMGIDSKTK